MIFLGNTEISSGEAPAIATILYEGKI